MVKLPSLWAYRYWHPTYKIRPTFVVRARRFLRRSFTVRRAKVTRHFL